MVTEPRYLASTTHAMLNENVVLQDKTSSSMSVRFLIFLAYEERQVSPIYLQWALHQRVPTLVKAPSKFPLLSALTMNLLTRSISWVLLTSKVLQTDSAYMPGSLVRFLLLVRLEMLSYLAVRFTCGFRLWDSTATNSIGLYLNA